MKQKARNRRVTSAAKSRPRTPLVWLGLTRAASLTLIAMILLVIGSGLSVVFMTHQDRVLFNELQQMRSQANGLDVEWGQLLIEQSTFGLEGRIEQKAMEQLNLHEPQLDRIVVVKHD